MDEIIPTSYNPILVALSYCFAVMGSYIALSGLYKLRTFREAKTNHRLEKMMNVPEHRTIVPSHRIYNATLIVAGIAFGGIGVWCMHFIGQLALNLPLDVHYALPGTVLSLVAAMGAAIWGLSIVAHNPYSWMRLFVGGAILGLGVSAMHYLGMLSMYFEGFFLWNWPMVLLSIVIAFAAATAGLWLAFQTNTVKTRVLASMVMGVAVSAMHYTGMAAAQVVCTTLEVAANAGTHNTLNMISELHLPVLLISLFIGIALAVTLNRMYAPHLRVGA